MGELSFSSPSGERRSAGESKAPPTRTLAEAAAAFPDMELIINVQGDEPLIDPEVIDELAAAFDGEEAMNYISNDSYDGIILDIMMPKMDGMEVLSELRKRHILTPVLLLTAKAEVDDRVAGLDAGADDYLAKPFAMKELLARIRSMIRRRDDYSEKQMRFEDIFLNAEDFALTAGNSIRLSIKEFELMQTLMANTDKGLTTEYLLSHVWSGEPDAQEDTVWLYISYLKGKLRAVGSSVAISGEKGGEFKLITK